MANFDVTTQSLGEVARLLQSAIATFDERVSNSDGVVHQIANGSWQGQDAELFASSWAQWHSSAMAIRMVLENISVTLLSAQSGYEGIESALDSSFDETTAKLTPAKPAAAAPASIPTTVSA